MMMIKSHELPFPTQLSFAIPRCFLQNVVFFCMWIPGSHLGVLHHTSLISGIGVST